MWRHMRGVYAASYERPLCGVIWGAFMWCHMRGVYVESFENVFERRLLGGVNFELLCNCAHNKQITTHVCTG